MSVRVTHTYVLLAISRSAYDEIRQALLAAGYDHAVDDADHAIDMHGIAVTPKASPEAIDPTWDEA